jgi:hypothetical protein
MVNEEATIAKGRDVEFEAYYQNQTSNPLRTGIVKQLANQFKRVRYFQQLVLKSYRNYRCVLK